MKESIFLKKKNPGQAALILILMLLSAVSVLVVAVGSITFNEIKKINDVVKSAQSYYASESGIEDAIYRIKNNMSYQNSYVLSVGTESTEVDVTGSANDPVITSKGDADDRVRKLQVGLHATTTSTSIAFNYGVQVGYGGLLMSNNAGVNGNVYSNGNISGSNGSFVTGTAIAANSPALASDQANESPSTPPNSINFGNTNGTQDAAQSFQVSNTNVVSRVDLYIRKVSTPGNLTVRITNNNGSNPGSTTLASATLSASSVTTSYGWVSVNFSSNPQLSVGNTYWLVLDGGTNSSRYYQWAANSAYTSGQAKTGPYSAGPWNTTSLDGYFRLYLGGLTGVINNVTVGTGSTGDARAHTVTNSTIQGNNYCQVGSGNNKPCNTSQADPTPSSFPISDANIAQWKSDAEAGGTITGDYTLTNGASATIGPTKITGNMSLSNNVTLTLTGTVWVQGTITLSNNVIIRLDSGYGSSGGVMLSDGFINLSNNSTFQGSGQATSYFLLVSTNDCDGIASTSGTGLSCTTGNSAIEVANNVGSVIIYGSRGQVHLSNNAGAKEVTGYKLSLDNNATVTYETGLASAQFSSGPGGGYDILSWQEVE